jgi:hypothetical protein
MSELKVDKVSPRTGNYVALNTVGMKNLIINGDMSIAQRGTSQASAGSTNGSYQTIDRFSFAHNNLGAFTWSQDTDVPSGQGFATSMKFDCTTADASPSAGDYAFALQYVEAQNCQYLKFGTSNATSLTLSFWVKSNKTGTYCFDIRSLDSSRLISKTYTISSTNTWEKKTITYDGDTVGTIDNDNGIGLQCSFWLGAGSNFTSGTLQTSWGSFVNANRAVGQVNLADDTANEWYITGVQLEAGTTASDFEFLPFDVNLQRCYRYYELVADGVSLPITNAAAYSSTKAYGIITFNTSKRATPSLDQVSGTDFYRFYNNNTDDRFDDFDIAIITTERARINNGDNFAVTTGHAGWFETNDTSCYVALDAEL